MSQALIDAAKAPVLAFSKKNWTAAKAAISPGYVYEEPATQRRVQGADEAIQLWRGWAAAFPDARAEIHSAVAGEQTVVLELTWTGTHTGPLPTATGTFAPTGRPISVRACQVTEISAGRAQATRHYFDMATLLKQIGVEMEATARAR